LIYLLEACLNADVTEIFFPEKKKCECDLLIQAKAIQFVTMYADGVSTTKRFFFTAKRQKLKPYFCEAYVNACTVTVLCLLQTNRESFQDLEADWAPWRADCLFIFN